MKRNDVAGDPFGEIGAEPLLRSGFEDEQPDTGFVPDRQEEDRPK